MHRQLQQRMNRLERRQGPPLRQRIVWWDRGDPEPVAAAGEQLTIIRWAWDDENELPSPPDGKAR
jgi:hypothetical protein